MNNLVQSGTQYAPTTAAPRELGVLARIDGISGSLFELYDKLTSFGSRLAGEGVKEGDSGRPIGPGISGILSAAEGRLRDCHQIVDALHKAF